MPAALTSAENLAFNQRAVTGLKLNEFWEGLRNGKFIRIAGIDAGDERIGR